jgi:hypothetical protein
MGWEMRNLAGPHGAKMAATSKDGSQPGSLPGSHLQQASRRFRAGRRGPAKGSNHPHVSLHMVSVGLVGKEGRTQQRVVCGKGVRGGGARTWSEPLAKPSSVSELCGIGTNMLTPAEQQARHLLPCHAIHQPAGVVQLPTETWVHGSRELACSWRTLRRQRA